jgi:hypothetical protein
VISYHPSSNGGFSPGLARRKTSAAALKRQRLADHYLKPDFSLSIRSVCSASAIQSAANFFNRLFWTRPLLAPRDV